MIEIKFNFKSMPEDDLEYILRKEELLEQPKRRFQIISNDEAKELYFPSIEGKVKVYVVVGGQKGDEGKAKTTALIRMLDSNVKWVMAPNSTHNAGKGVYTLDEEGNSVRLSLHLCPETIVDREMKNYIGPNTQTNLFSLEKEVNDMRKVTGRIDLGKDYHLMLDLKSNLVVPTNRADDVVNKKNAMGSTISGATSSFMYAAGKKAPLVEHALYDHDQFIKHVDLQIRYFNDNIKHDEEFSDLGITDMYTFGLALRDKDKLKQNERLVALESKLSEAEIEFFSNENPAQYLLEQFKDILGRNLFETGNTRKEIHKQIDAGEAGILEGVQSSLLSGEVAYSKNRTAAHTHGMGIIGDAGLTHEAIDYEKVVSMKYGNTSVGGNDKTISGFIRQDQLSKLSAITPEGESVTFEKTATLEKFLSPEQINEAFKKVDNAFYEAIENGYSLKNSTIHIENIDTDFNLVEARALLIAYALGETGETSKRSRVVRFEDKNETAYMRSVEGSSVEVRNALDRILIDRIAIIEGYHAKENYGPYKKGQEIKPGMRLLQEHLTVKSCIPYVRLLKGCPSLFDDGTSDPAPGKVLHENANVFLSLTHDGKPLLAIGTGKETDEIYCVKEI